MSNCHCRLRDSHQVLRVQLTSYSSQQPNESGIVMIIPIFGRGSEGSGNFVEVPSIMAEMRFKPMFVLHRSPCSLVTSALHSRHGTPGGL